MQTLKYLTEEETDELYQIINQDKTLHSTRNRAIFYVAKYCALRASEIGMINLTDYRPIWKTLFCKREKNSLNNTIKIIDDDVLQALDDYYKQRIKMDVDSKVLFISQKGTPISRKTLHWLMKKYCAQTSISIDKHHMHTLKHTRAIELANSGADIKDIQWWLGHRNVNNTLIYMQYTTRQQEALYEKLEKENRKNAKKKKTR